MTRFRRIVNQPSVGRVLLLLAALCVLALTGSAGLARASSTGAGTVYTYDAAATFASTPTTSPASVASPTTAGESTASTYLGALLVVHPFVSAAEEGVSSARVRRRTTWASPEKGGATG